VLRGKRSKSSFDFCIAAAIENDKPLSKCAGRFLHVPNLYFADRRIRVYEQGYNFRARNEFAQQSQSLCS
jgi:hypothetical protein